MEASQLLREQTESYEPSKARKRPPKGKVESAKGLSLDEVVQRGLANLPFDSRQRARARVLVRDVLSRG